MKRDRRTVFVVTHRPNVLGVADKVMILAGGQVQAYGPREAVLKALTARAKGQPTELPAAGASASEEKAA